VFWLPELVGVTGAADSAAESEPLSEAPTFEVSTLSCKAICPGVCVCVYCLVFTDAGRFGRSVTSIRYINAYGDEANNTRSCIPQLDCYVGSCKEYPVFEVLLTDRTSDTEYVIACSHEMQERLPLAGFISIVPDVSIGSAPVAVSVVIEGNVLRITADKPVSFRQRVQIILNNYSSLRFHSTETSWLLVPAFTAVFPPEPVYADDSTITAAPLAGTLINKQVYYSDNEYEEQSSINISYSCTLAATQVGPVPI